MLCKQERESKQGTILRKAKVTTSEKLKCNSHKEGKKKTAFGPIELTDFFFFSSPGWSSEVMKHSEMENKLPL